MRPALLFLVVVLSPLALATPYPQHGDCGSGGQPALQRIEITGGSAATTFYVDDENYLLGNGVWLYAESNGVWVSKAPGTYLEGLSNANLQAGSDSPIFPDADRLCWDEVDAGPDVLIL